MSAVIYLLPSRKDERAPVCRLIEQLSEQIGNLPSDDLTPGFRVLPETRADLRSLTELLNDVVELLDVAIEREDERYNDYADHYERLHPEEA